MEFNDYMERLEKKLYEHLERLVDAGKYAEAKEVVELMTSCGIV